MSAKTFEGSVSIVRNTKNEIALKRDPEGRFNAGNAAECYSTMQQLAKKNKFPINKYSLFIADGGTPYAESGPYEIGNGDNIMSVRRVIPDEQTLGEVVVSFKTRMYPMATETTYGPYSAAQPTDVRFAARQVKVRYTGDVLDDWQGLDRCHDHFDRI